MWLELCTKFWVIKTLRTDKQKEVPAHQSFIGMPWSVFNMVLKQNLVKLIMNTDIILMDKPCGTGTFHEVR